MKAIRLHIKQNSANYRREETVNCRMTYPLPPYSTVIGAIHKACGYKKYHPMNLSIQGRYGSLVKKIFKEDCFLNNIQDDRGILVKMCSSDIISSAYNIVATAQKTKGNSFEKGITINVVNQSLLDEYRFLNKTKKRIDQHKKLIKVKKDKIKQMKKAGIASNTIKQYNQKINTIDKVYKIYEEEKYNKPKTSFRTLTKVPKYSEILCDIELIIHIVSDEKTMNDILENSCNLTAIGRGEDFVDIVDICKVELYETVKKNFINKEYEDINSFQAYIPIDIIENNNKSLKLMGQKDGILKNGTKYLLCKDYTLDGQKRIFNKVPVLFTSRFRIKNKADGVYFDIDGEKIYSVFLV